MNVPDPQAQPPVTPLAATVGSIAAGAVGYAVTWLSQKAHMPVDMVSGLLTLFFTGATSWWHQSKSG